MQRIDKFLWYARFFKTRTLAQRAVENGKIRRNGERVEKASLGVRAGDVLTFPQGPHVRVIQIAADGTRRGPPAEARALYVDLAPPQKKPEAPPSSPTRPKGMGRPTKKERRAIDRLRPKRA